MSRQWSEEEDNQIKEKYGKIKISEFSLDRTNRAIQCRASLLGVVGDMVTAKRIHSINERAFRGVNNESAYWAGVLASDGTIYQNRVSLECVDKDLVEGLRSFLGYSGKIGSRTREGRKTSYYIKVNNINIVEDLKRIWNITSQKSKTLQPPKINKCIKPFIIGCIDGDGWVYRNNRGRLLLGCCGTHSLMEWVSKHLDYKNKIYQNSKCKHVYKIEFSGRFAEDKLKELLTIKTPHKLKRKWEQE